MYHSHLPPAAKTIYLHARIKTDLINTETICHHEQSCIISHLSRAVSNIPEKTMIREERKRERGNLFLKEGGPPLHDFCESHYAHMVLTVMRQVQ